MLRADKKQFHRLIVDFIQFVMMNNFDQYHLTQAQLLISIPLSMRLLGLASHLKMVSTYYFLILKNMTAF